MTGGAERICQSLFGLGFREIFGMDKKRQIQILQIIKSNNERENLVKGLALETPNRAQVCQQGHGVVRCHKTWGTLIQV